MADHHVCRLCMSNEELLWIFDKKNISATSMKEIVIVTTGVEISEKDLISQKICQTCRELTLKMYNFRERANKTDKYLKDKCKDLLSSSKITMKIPNTNISIKTEKKWNGDVKKNNCSKIDEPKISIKCVSSLKEDRKISTITKNTLPVEKLENGCDKPGQLLQKINPQTKDIAKTAKRTIHPSIDNIFSTYKGIKVHPVCLPLDVNPSVCMEMNVVEEYFRRNNLDMEKAVQVTLKSLKGSKTYKSRTKKSTDSKENDKSVRIDEENKSAADQTSILEERNINLIDIKVDEVSIPNTDTKGIKRTRLESDSEDLPQAMPNKFKRRRLSSSDFSSDTEPGASIHKILKESIPKKNAHRCSICNVVEVNSKALRAHLEEHLHCRFCKSRFKMVEIKEDHENVCLVNAALNSRPYVALTRILVLPSASLDTKNTDKDTTKGVIEFSDNGTQIDVTSYSKNSSSLSAKSPVKENVAGINSPMISSSSHSLSFQPITSGSIGTITPSINIIDSSLLDTVDTAVSEVQILKNLLTKTIPLNKKHTVENGSQIVLPLNDQISINSSNNTAELKNLISHLSVYKIPLNVSNGKFHLSYSDPTKQPAKKEIQLWSLSSVTDIKSSNNFNSRLAKGHYLLKHIQKSPPVTQLNTSTAVSIAVNNQITQTQSLAQPSRKCRSPQPNLSTAAIIPMNNPNAQKYSLIKHKENPLLKHVQQSVVVTQPKISTSVTIPRHDLSPRVLNVDRPSPLYFSGGTVNVNVNQNISQSTVLPQSTETFSNNYLTPSQSHGLYSNTPQLGPTVHNNLNSTTPYSSQTSVSTNTQGYINPNVNFTSNNNYLLQSSIPNNTQGYNNNVNNISSNSKYYTADQQNYNLSMSYINNVMPLQSLVNNNTPGDNLGAHVLNNPVQPLIGDVNHSTMPNRLIVRNSASNTSPTVDLFSNQAPTTNNGVLNNSSSSGMSNAVVQYTFNDSFSKLTTGHVATRPFIRVRNLCDLK